MEAKLEKMAVRLDKHGDDILRLLEREKHGDVMMDQFHKESDSLRKSMHKLRNDMQVLMGDFHSFRKANNQDVINHRLDSRKAESERLSARMESGIRGLENEVHSLSIEAHAATENTALLHDIQTRLRALEVQMPLLQNSKSWMDKAMMAMMTLGMAFLTGKALLGGSL